MKQINPLDLTRKRYDRLAFIFDILNPMVVRMTGANINRRTSENVHKAGWRIKEEALFSSDIVKLIHA